MSRKAVTGGDVYTPRRIVPGAAVLIDGQKIVGVVDGADVPDDFERVDAAGKVVAPGFVDTHIHGGGGGDFMDGTPEAVEQAVKLHALHGTTSLLATTATAPMEKIFRAFDNVREMIGKVPGGAEILGIHMEGPYFAKPEPGCHDADLIHEPVSAEVDRIMEYAGLIRRVTVAPEIDGALDLIALLAANGIVASGGHSQANYRETRLGVEAGMTHLTHHWSAMAGVHRVEAKRYSGMIEAGIACDDLTTEVIADGKHLPTSLLRLAYKCKGREGLCLISDSMRAAGMPEGRYEVCELEAIVEGGVAYTLDRKAFASSVITMDKAVQHMARVVGTSLLDTLYMATLSPARIIGVDDRKGSLEAGKDADVILLDPVTLAVEKVFLKGAEI